MDGQANVGSGVRALMVDWKLKLAMQVASIRRQERSVRLPTLLMLLSVALATLTGCGDGRPKRLQVSGQVLIDGEPLTMGYIRFVPQGSRPSGSQLDEEGRFTLSCYGENDGIIPGVHRVEIDASESLSSTKTKWHAPKKYFRYKTSGLTQEIGEATDSLVIHLTWDGGKPFVERGR